MSLFIFFPFLVLYCFISPAFGQNLQSQDCISAYALIEPKRNAYFWINPEDWADSRLESFYFNFASNECSDLDASLAFFLDNGFVPKYRYNDELNFDTLTSIGVLLYAMQVILEPTVAVPEDFATCAYVLSKYLSQGCNKPYLLPYSTEDWWHQRYVEFKAQRKSDNLELEINPIYITRILNLIHYGVFMQEKSFSPSTYYRYLSYEGEPANLRDSIHLKQVIGLYLDWFEQVKNLGGLEMARKDSYIPLEGSPYTWLEEEGARLRSRYNNNPTSAQLITTAVGIVGFETKKEAVIFKQVEMWLDSLVCPIFPEIINASYHGAWQNFYLDGFVATYIFSYTRPHFFEGNKLSHWAVKIEPKDWYGWIRQHTWMDQYSGSLSKQSKLSKHPFLLEGGVTNRSETSASVLVYACLYHGWYKGLKFRHVKVETKKGRTISRLNPRILRALRRSYSNWLQDLEKNDLKQGRNFKHFSPKGPYRIVVW